MLRVSSSTSDSYRKKVYTKFGDSGETSLLYGGRISKNSPNTEAYGITDEAVSVMGLARAMTDDQRVNELLRDLQRELFTIAAELATDPGKYELLQIESRGNPPACQHSLRYRGEQTCVAHTGLQAQ